MIARCGQVRDLYWTFRNFRNRVADFLRYRRVTANMDERCGSKYGVQQFTDFTIVFIGEPSSTRQRIGV